LSHLKKRENWINLVKGIEGGVVELVILGLLSTFYSFISDLYPVRFALQLFNRVNF